MHEDDMAPHSFGQPPGTSEKWLEHLRHALDDVNCQIEVLAGVARGTSEKWPEHLRHALDDVNCQIAVLAGVARGPYEKWMEHLRHALDDVNCQIGAFAGTKGGSSDMIGYWATHPERTCAEDYDNPDQRRECLAVMALDAESRKKLLDACHERDTIIRNLRVTDAGANRAHLVGAEHVNEIVWDSPVVNKAFQCLDKAIDWDGPGAGMDPIDCSHIYNPITNEVALDQLTPFTARALYNGLVFQLSDEDLSELETTLSDIQSTTGETGERNGLDFLLSFVHRAQREHERAPMRQLREASGVGAAWGRLTQFVRHLRPRVNPF